MIVSWQCFLPTDAAYAATNTTYAAYAAQREKNKQFLLQAIQEYQDSHS
jgi:hypothetical protein